MDRLQSMQIFARVVEMHSFSRAADSLSLPSSRVTRAVKDLETFLGVRLLQRTTRHISLTPDGTLYYDQCRRLLADIEAVESSFPGSAGQPVTVELAQSQLTLMAQPGTSILDALIEADVFVSYECKRGECGNCYTQVVEGETVHRDVCLTPAQRALGMCICVSWASSQRIVLDL